MKSTKRLLVATVFFWSSLAGAVDLPFQTGDSDQLLANSTYFVGTNVPLTAPRTITLPRVDRTCVSVNSNPACPSNVLMIIDLANAINGSNTLSIAPNAGDTIGGSALPIQVARGGSVALRPVPGNNWWIENSVNSGGSTMLDVTSFGAKGNTEFYGDGVATAGSATFTATNSHPFASTDCNAVHGAGCTGTADKKIAIDYAGAGGVTLTTTIVGFTSASQVTLATNALSTTGTWTIAALIPSVIQSGAGSYAVNDTITDGNFTAVIDATQLGTATVGASGSGGFITTQAGGTQGTGNCPIIGTTGDGQSGLAGGQYQGAYQFNAPIVGGALAAPGTVVLPDTAPFTGLIRRSVYLTAPSATDPVKSYATCAGLTGASLNVKMGPVLARITNGGTYSSNQLAACSPAATCTSSGAGTGATFGAISVLRGAFAFGTDDTAAITTAFNTSAGIATAGGASCVGIPAGKYWVSAPLPMWINIPGCVKGVDQSQSILFASPEMTGDLLTWSEVWAGSAGLAQGNVGDVNFIGGLATGTKRNGPRLSDLTLVATRVAGVAQNAIVLYDRNASVQMSNLTVWGFNGYCFAGGILNRSTVAGVIESDFTNIKTFLCGNPTSTPRRPAVLWDSQSTLSVGAEATNSIRIRDWQVYSSIGHGMSFRSSSGLFGSGGFHIMQVRIEGIQFGPYLFPAGTADQFHIGDAADPLPTNGVICIECLFTSPYLNNYGIRVDGPAVAPFGIDWQGAMAGNAGYGLPILLTRGRANNFYIRNGFVSTGCDVSLAPTTGGGNQISVIGAGEESPGTTGTFVGTQYCQNGASGITLTRNLSIDGNGTAYLGGVFDITRTRAGSVMYPGQMLGNNYQSGQTSQAMTCTTSNTVACIATIDGLVPGATNCINIPYNLSIGIDVSMQVKDITNPANYYTARWNNAHVLSKGTTNASTLVNGAAGTVAPDSTRSNPAGLFGGATISPNVGVNMGCLNVVYTPQAGNTDTLIVSVAVRTVE